MFVSPRIAGSRCRRADVRKRSASDLVNALSYLPGSCAPRARCYDAPATATNGVSAWTTPSFAYCDAASALRPAFLAAIYIPSHAFSTNWAAAEMGAARVSTAV